MCVLGFVTCCPWFAKKYKVTGQANAWSWNRAARQVCLSVDVDRRGLVRLTRLWLVIFSLWKAALLQRREEGREAEGGWKEGVCETVIGRGRKIQECRGWREETTETTTNPLPWFGH